MVATLYSNLYGNNSIFLPLCSHNIDSSLMIALWQITNDSIVFSDSSVVIVLLCHNVSGNVFSIDWVASINFVCNIGESIQFTRSSIMRSLINLCSAVVIIVLGRCLNSGKSFLLSFMIKFFVIDSSKISFSNSGSLGFRRGLFLQINLRSSVE